VTRSKPAHSRLVQDVDHEHSIVPDHERDLLNTNVFVAVIDQ